MTATTGNRVSTNSTGKSVKVNRSSKLLTRDENEQVFQLLGSKRQVFFFVGSCLLNQVC